MRQTRFNDRLGKIMLTKVVEREPRRRFARYRQCDLGYARQFVTIELNIGDLIDGSCRSKLISQGDSSGVNQLDIVGTGRVPELGERLKVCGIGSPFPTWYC